jgi:N-acetylmuramoyl-L-alanine amidase
MRWSEGQWTGDSDQWPVISGQWTVAIERRSVPGGPINEPTYAEPINVEPINGRLASFAQFAKNGWFRRGGATAVFCRFLLPISIFLALTVRIVVAQTPAAQTQRFVVVLDAAHGGDDTGGHSGAWTEKAFTLALSVRLRSLLAARGFEVVTTREQDEALDAERRDEIANHAQAQACLSLHASLSGNGVHLFVSSLAPVQRARFVPWKTAQATAVARSLGLAGVLNSALGQAGLGVTLGRTALPVVDSMMCPAVAVEVAPSASSGQSATDSLNDAGYQAKVAEALAAALVEWRGNALETGAHQP